MITNLQFFRDIHNGISDPVEKDVAPIRTILRVAGVLTAGTLLPLFDAIADVKKLDIINNQIADLKRLMQLKFNENSIRCLAGRASCCRLEVLDDIIYHTQVSLFGKMLIQSGGLMVLGAVARYYINKEEEFSTLAYFGNAAAVTGSVALLVNYPLKKTFNRRVGYAKTIVDGAEQLANPEEV